MRFTERREFLYDAAFAGRHDVQTALKINAEYTLAASAKNPFPTVYEIDRSNSRMDPLWHMPLDERTPISRTFEIPIIIKNSTPDWRLTRVGIVPQQRCEMWFSNLHLQTVDWWPVRGDMVYWNGYRNMIVAVELRPESFWGQTNVWLNVVCKTVIPAEGDARPLANPTEPAPREVAMTRPLPEA